MVKKPSIALPGKRKDNIAIGNCSAEASMDYSKWFTMQLKGKRFVFSEKLIKWT